jgi:hypothetical protein
MCPQLGDVGLSDGRVSGSHWKVQTLHDGLQGHSSLIQHIGVCAATRNAIAVVQGIDVLDLCDAIPVGAWRNGACCPLLAKEFSSNPK